MHTHTNTHVTDTANLFADYIIQQLICRMVTFDKLRHSENPQLAFAAVCYLNILVALHKVLF